MFSVPHAVIKDERGQYSIDLPSQMFKDRIVYLTGEVNETMADAITLELISLDTDPAHEPIHMYINSPGGSVVQGMAIYNVMKSIKSPVYTYCMSQAASMGAFLLSSGDKRYCFKESEVMIHQPLGGAQGQASDIEIQAEHIKHTKYMLNSILAMNTGKDIDTIAKDTDRDNYLTAEEALEYGLVDEIIPFAKKIMPAEKTDKTENQATQNVTVQ